MGVIRKFCLLIKLSGFLKASHHPHGDTGAVPDYGAVCPYIVIHCPYIVLV